MPLHLDDVIALSRLLDEAFDLHADDVEPWIGRLAAPDRHLAAQLREMLQTHHAQDGGGFLMGSPALDADVGDETVAHAGELIGPYVLIREIGRGGMGAVWLAQRADGSLKRHVALKLPRLAWDEGLSERMAEERDIGALLEHPNIARLYDAGVDARGRPYLALEHVDGQPLDAWCTAQALSLPERLRLFLQVVRAVAYAHGRLVVHRDLKASNVLVTADGQSHLLDFGIAKLLTDPALGDEGLTRQQGRMLTPHTASPEQLRGGTITVASDVYSLGGLLYEILTGKHPYVVNRNSAAAFEQAILEGEPMPASRRTSDAAIARQLKGNLDSILSKALKREPMERYASADAMAADIERHLQGDRVMARPDKLTYRINRSLRRNRLAYAAAAAVSIAILAGSGLSIVQARRANAEAERARLVKEFVIDIFNTQTGPDGAMGQMPSLTLLERGARLIDRKFAGQPLLRAELYGVVSTMFFNIANLEQAAAYATQQIETLDADDASGTAIARATLRLADIFIPMERNEDALIRAQKVLDLAGGDAALQARAHALKGVALLLGHSDTARAAQELDAADAALRAGDVPDVDRAVVALARGEWFSFANQPDDARAQFDRAIALGLAADGPTSLQALYGRQEAAKTLIWAGQFEAGKAYLAAALETRRAAGGPDDVNAAMWEAFSADWLFHDGGATFDEAMQIYRRSLASMKAQNWQLPAHYVAGVELRMGSAYLLWGDIERGSQLVLSSAERDAIGADPLAQWWKRASLVRALSSSARADEAVVLAREMLALQKEWATSNLRLTYGGLALALVNAMRYEEAESVLAEYDALPAAADKQTPEARAHITLDEVRILIALQRGRPKAVVDMTARLTPKEMPHQDEVAWLSRATALCQTGAADQGLRLFGQWLPQLATDRYEADPNLAFWRAQMGLCALQSGHRQQALEASRQAAQAIARQPGVSARFKVPVEQLQARLKPV